MWTLKRILNKQSVLSALSLKASVKNQFKFSMFSKTNAFLMSTLALGGIMMYNMKYGMKMSTLCQGTRIDYAHPNVRILDHVAVPYLISNLRDPECTPVNFRNITDRIMRLLMEQAIGEEPMSITKRTALTGGDYDHYDLKYPIQDYCVITIMRAGDSMLGSAFEIMPGVSVGKILIQRDEKSAEKKPIYYYSKIPASIAKKKRIFILDPMLGTAGSICCAIAHLVEKGVDEENITFINLISCPEGLDKITSTYPKVKVLTAVCDPEMNSHKYIDPGLGDFGDRYFNSN